jgi:mannose-6-phosphate isomerase-like protein (cupin superfamily)
MSATFPVQVALAALAQAGGEFTTLYRHGTLEVEIYRPVGTDQQKPHRRDELYVVISGTGAFLHGPERTPFRAGDVLFVEAGIEHRFVDFTEDFATWVFFYGPDGGETR